jgi:hypothetical protein
MCPIHLIGGLIVCAASSLPIVKKIMGERYLMDQSSSDKSSQSGGSKNTYHQRLSNNIGHGEVEEEYYDNIEYELITYVNEKTKHCLLTTSHAEWSGWERGNMKYSVSPVNNDYF